MDEITLQSIWRGVGYIGFVVSVIGCMALVVTPFLETPTYWAGVDFELAHGRWGHWLLLLVLTFGIAILTTSCYLAANERPILKLEPVWFFAIPLAPVLVLWGIDAKSRRLTPANSP